MSTTTKRLLAIGGVGIVLNMVLRAFGDLSSHGVVTIDQIPTATLLCGFGAIFTGSLAAILASKKRNKVCDVPLPELRDES
jgi:hypothetical protein